MSGVEIFHYVMIGDPLVNARNTVVPLIWFIRSKKRHKCLSLVLKKGKRHAIYSDEWVRIIQPFCANWRPQLELAKESIARIVPS